MIPAAIRALAAISILWQDPLCGFVNFKQQRNRDAVHDPIRCDGNNAILNFAQVANVLTFHIISLMPLLAVAGIIND